MRMAESKHTETEDDMLSISAAAQIIGVHVDTLRRWEEAGRIIVRRTPTGHRRYRRADVEAILEQRVAS
jgi:excisionase family DNA binding protein